MARAQTETRNRDHAQAQDDARQDLSVSPQVRMAEVKRFELLRGCPNTLSNTADPRSPQSATGHHLRRHRGSGRR